MTDLYKQYGGNSYGKMIEGFNDFARKVKGNPQEQVQQLLNSGKVSQAQYNAAVQKANMLRGIFGI